MGDGSASFSIFTLFLKLLRPHLFQYVQKDKLISSFSIRLSN